MLVVGAFIFFHIRTKSHILLGYGFFDEVQFLRKGKIGCETVIKKIILGKVS
jgi:hypothetical protein